MIANCLELIRYRRKNYLNTDFNFQRTRFYVLNFSTLTPLRCRLHGVTPFGWRRSVDLNRQITFSSAYRWIEILICKQESTPLSLKRTSLRLVANGAPILSVARKMGISDSFIHAWRTAGKKNKGGEKQPSVLEEEVDSLRRQLRQTEMERDILKKAVAIFSRMT